jgi:hypothetical protein
MAEAAVWPSGLKKHKTNLIPNLMIFGIIRWKLNQSSVQAGRFPRNSFYPS